MSVYAEQIEFLQSGNLQWALATVDFYAANSTTRVDVYSDRAKSVAVANPYTMNSLGRPATPLYADGLIKIVINPIVGSTITFDYQSHGFIDGPWIDVTAYASLNAAVSAIGSTASTLLIASTIPMTDNLTIPSSLSLQFQNGGMIDNDGYALTINVPFSAEPYQVFTGSGAIAFGPGAVTAIYPEWFGAVADGTTDSTAALQKAINVTSKVPRVLACGTYKITSTLTITANNTVIRGGGRSTLGSVIRYYGTGTAVQVGVSPVSTGDFIQSTDIQNIRIEVDNNSYRGMHVWQSAGGFFSNITIFGNKGAGNIGLHVQGGLDNIYERVQITGSGQTTGAGPSEYVAIGARLELGFGNQPATTTVFRRCYFNYCKYAVSMNYRYDFEDCVFEASEWGVQSLTYFLSNFTRCWWEANTDGDIYFNTSVANITGGAINSYARQVFFASGGGIRAVSIQDTMFFSSHATPILFSTGNNLAPSGSVKLSGVLLPAATTIGGAGSSTYPFVKNVDMSIVTYRFIVKAYSGSVAAVMTTEGGLAGSFVLPQAGHVIGFNIIPSGTITGGSYVQTVKINGSNLASLSSPTIPAKTAQYTHYEKFYAHRFVAGDVLSVYFAGSSLAPALDYMYEVTVALGQDGIGL